MARACAVLEAIVALAAPAAAQQRYNGGITVFADINFSGNSRTFQQDVPNMVDLGFNDAISSIQVAEGEVWQICRDANYQGRCQNVTGGISDLRTLNWNDEISSLRRVSGGFRGRGPGGFARGGPVVVYTEPNFRGRSATLRQETPNIVPLGLNDQITSIEIPRGEAWEICVDIDYGGRCTVLSESVPDLRRIGWNDRISSLRRVSGPYGEDRGWGRRGYPDYRQRAQAELVFYERPNFRGGTIVLTHEFSNRTGLPWGGSLQVRGGGVWELCDKWGQCVTVDRDVPYLDDLGLDRITRVREVNTTWPFIR